MNIFAFSSFLVIVSSTLIAILLFWKGRNRYDCILLALFCLAAAIWGLGAFKISTCISKETSLFWWQISYIGAILSPLLYCHFVLAFLKANKKYIIIIAYVLASIFMFFNWYNNSSLLIGDLRFVFNQFYCIDWFKQKNFLYLFFYISFYWVLLTYTFVIMLKAYFNSTDIFRN